MTDQADEPAVDEVLYEDIRGDNVDPDGVAHACGISQDGDDFCIGCRKPWPCPHGIRLRVEELAPAEPEPTAESVIAASVSTGLPWAVVADELEVPRGEVQALLDASTS